MTPVRVKVGFFEKIQKSIIVVLNILSNIVLTFINRC